jgi:hypothetical protein
VNMTRIAGVLLCIVTLVTSSTVYGDEKVQKNGFSVTLPDGWVEIPRDAIDSYEKNMAELVPNAQLQHYDYGFQLNTAKNWLEYPYVLIQVKNLGRIPERQLEQLEGFPVQKTIDDQKEKFNGVMSDVQAGKMIYDNRNKMIWMHMEFKVRDVGPVSAIVGMVLTESGFIQANAYCVKDDYPSYESIFRTIATSVTPDRGMEYKPKWSDNLPVAVTGIDWGKVAGNAAVGAMIGGIVALLAGLKRKRGIKRDKGSSN